MEELFTDTRAIGVFDSGLGGLTAVRELRRILPGENLCYFGDTARVPYGSRGRETIRRFASECLDFLERQDVKLIIVACGTVSSVLADEMGSRPVPCIGVVGPTAEAATAATKNGKIGLIATAATVASRSYEKAVKALAPEAEFEGVACPLLVPLVENGYTDFHNEITRKVLSDYFEKFRLTDMDTLILGCTHYPLLYTMIDEMTGRKLFLIDSGRETALAAARYLKENGLLNESGETGKMKFFLTDTGGSFADLGREFLGEELPEVEKISPDDLI
ncbi:MAG TPA: glutamate racemase [Oscillospiraceae bacterium]|nr:glutamate racemase [Oscillospiraceae bacterium]